MVLCSYQTFENLRNYLLTEIYSSNQAYIFSVFGLKKTVLVLTVSDISQ